MCLPVSTMIDLSAAKRKGPHGAIIRWRSLHNSLNNGLGSNAKGLISMLAIAILLNARLVVETDCPDLSVYYTSPVMDLVPEKQIKTLQRGQVLHRCAHFLTALQDPAANVSYIQHNLFVASSRSGGKEMAIFCERHLLHLFYGPSVELRQKFVDAYGLGRLSPAHLFGCMWKYAMKPKLWLLKKVSTFTPAGSGGGVLFGIQLRRGGRKVSWKDPSRLRTKSYAELNGCLEREVAIFVRKHAQSSRIFLTGDSPTIMADFEASVRKTLKTHNVSEQRGLILNDPSVFFHTALSTNARNNRTNHDKVVVDFEILSRCDQLLVTRSGFGEAAAWIAFSWNSSRANLVEVVCGFPGGIDCSISSC